MKIFVSETIFELVEHFQNKLGGGGGGGLTYIKGTLLTRQYTYTCIDVGIFLVKSCALFLYNWVCLCAVLD